jgi:SAM-dependent methyltransferase
VSGYVHIDEKVRILTDEAARQVLAQENDSAFVDPVRGITRVTRERWMTAQRAERTHWMDLGIRAMDDRNFEHLSHFDGYGALRGMRFERAIELGCGPFTNLRLIADVCSVGECDLLDPLIDEYVGHPYCRYSRGALLVENASLPEWFRRQMSRFAWAVRRGYGLRLGRPKAVPVDRRIASPIEEMPRDRAYDLVVMVNVLEHCYDVDRVFESIRAITRPGSVIVFHDKYYDPSDAMRLSETCYDAAHPLRVGRGVVEAGLADFESLLMTVDPVHSEFGGCSFDNDYVYFVGRRKAQ